MKEYTFSSKSWHYKLANVGVQRVWDFEEIDICSYIRKVLAGALVFVAAFFGATAIAIFFGYGFITLGMWFVDCLTSGNWVLPNPIAGLILFTILLIVFGFIIVGVRILLEKAIDKFVDYTIEHRHPQLVKEKEPSFIAAAYRKFKDKTCFRINFK